MYHYSIGKWVGEREAISLSESLKSNTTLTILNLRSDNKRKKAHTRHPSAIHSFPFLFTSTDNNIRDTGAKSLSESLKSNTTLTILDLSGEDKRKTHKRHLSTIYSFPFLFTLTDNKIEDTGATSLSESLKLNTALIAFDLSGEDKRKKTHKRH